MNLTRKSSSTKWPIQRKGTKYLARPRSNINSSVTVVLAVRDMLKLAKTAKEVKKIMQAKNVKINGRIIHDLRQSISLFNILTVGKDNFILSLLPTKKYFFDPVSSFKTRLCKVVNKRLISSKKIQLSLHDGTNVLTDKEVSTNETVSIDMQGKLVSVIPFKVGNKIIVVSGGHMGEKGVINAISPDLLTIKFNDGGSAEIAPRQVFCND